jgi:hypothetical protein
MTPRLRIIAPALLLAALGVLLSSCANPGEFCLFGYATAPQYPAHIRTVRVPIFKNETFVRGIEFELTEAVVKHIEAKTPWKVVHHEGADAELTGKIINVAKRVIIKNQLNEVRDAEVRLGVEVLWRDCHACPPVTDPLPPIEDAPPAPPETVPLGHHGRLPPGKPIIFVQRSATFIPELGESMATARQRVVNELATQVVNMLEVPW